MASISSEHRIRFDSASPVPRWVCAPLVALIWSGVCFAQTTGRIEGLTLDDQGAPLPGVILTLDSDSLKGTRTAASNRDGLFRFPALPPGSYRLVGALQGYSPIEVGEITVDLDSTATVELVLTEAITDEIVVREHSRALDTRSTTTGAVFSDALIEALPTPRTVESLALASPSVIDGGLGEKLGQFRSSPSVRGASAAENRYLINGLDVTDPGYGVLSTSLAFEFVEAVEVKSGGYEAEYGGALGGVLNVLTKSGTNRLRGDLFGYFTDDSLQATSPETRRFGQTLGLTEFDFGFDLGGKLVTDRLWYFLALNPSFLEQDQTNTQKIPFSTRLDRLYCAAKLDWQIDASKTLVASAFGDPSQVEDEPIAPAAGRIGHDFDFGGRSWSVDFGSLIGDHVYLEAFLGRYEQEFSQTPFSEESPAYQDLQGSGYWAKQQECGDSGAIEASGIWFAEGCVGGVLAFEPDDRKRDQVRAATSWLAGTHDLEIGGEYRRLENNRSYRYPAPTSAPLVDSTGFVVAPQGVAGAIFELGDGYYDIFVVSSASVGETNELALFAQDSWQPRPWLTINLGMRSDSFRSEGQATSEFPDRALDFGFNDMIAPRFGVVVDPMRNGHSKLSASAARYYESVPLDINVRTFGNERGSIHFFLYPEDGSLPTYSNLGAYLFGFEFGLGASVDPDVEPMYTDELMLGFQYQLRPDLTFGLTGVHREIRQVVEDISVDDGQTYFITNPGGTYTVNPVTGQPLPEPVTFPEAERQYKALELTLNKRLRNNWQLGGSYVYSSNEGNYPGLYRQATGQLDPNITSLFDLPELLDGAYGPLPNDRPHQIKFFGSYLVRNRLTIGFFGQYLSGTPVNKLGDHTLYGSGERFIVPRGAAGRTPALQNLDLHLAYEIPLRKRWRLNLIADVFNVTNQQKPIVVDEIWTFSSAFETTDPNECGGPGTGAGTDCPEGNPEWGEPREYQSPRVVRLGIRLSW